MNENLLRQKSYGTLAKFQKYFHDVKISNVPIYESFDSYLKTREIGVWALFNEVLERNWR